MTEEKGRTKAARTNITPKHSNKMLVCLEQLYLRGCAGINTLFEVLTNCAGWSTRFMRYWLNDEQRKLVAELLGFDVDGGAV